jgi:hypothetical protein
MKNIHLLPTDKPSRLRYFDGKLELMYLIPKKSDIIFQHIYITSNEEIKKGDWFLPISGIGWKLNILIKANGNGGYHNEHCKKIILTTNQSLDGVQAIDDEFLEWFVKNPSCEEVEFEKYGYMPEEPCEYKIIFLKEEPKQETLEEAAKKYATNHGMMAHIFPEKEKSFIEGAKWQEKRMCEVTENTSDGYHTFKELYEFRKAYNVALFNQWGSILVDFTLKYDVHKSWKHHDGELCFGGGWFIVVAVLPTGQISNHYPASDWDLFKIPEVEKAKYPFDGHTGQDVIDRLLNIKYFI